MQERSLSEPGSVLLRETEAIPGILHLQPVMELEYFDLMVQFVSMGMGAALIPRRCFGTFRRKGLVRMIAPPAELSRPLIVISPKHGKRPEHVDRFVGGILFS